MKNIVIYIFNNKEEQIKRTSCNENDKISKINIIIYYPVKSLKGLFSNVDVLNLSILKNFICYN